MGSSHSEYTETDSINFMEKDRRLIIAGNWKMNKTVAEALDLVQDLVREVQQVKEVDVVICPAFTALGEVSKKVIETNIRLGAQNMSEQAAGAHTGEIAAEMLKEFLVRYVILGHSERRQYQEETDSLISKKALAAHAASIKPIVCVGETLEQRDSGVTNDVVGSQVKGSLAGLTSSQMLETIIAYEPVWAIGTGKTASSEQAQEYTTLFVGCSATFMGMKSPVRCVFNTAAVLNLAMHASS